MNYLSLQDKVVTARSTLPDVELEGFTSSASQLEYLAKLGEVVKDASLLYHDQFEGIMPIGDFWRAIGIEEVREFYFKYASFLD